MKLDNRVFIVPMAALGMFMPTVAHAHLVNSNVGEFYAGMLHPLTSAEHVLPMVALALLASQCGKQAGRMTILLFPLALLIGILGGSRFPLADVFHFANLAALLLLGGLIISAPRLTVIVPAIAAIVIGVILGWRSGGDWAASGVGFQFIPGVALTGFLVMVMIAAWVPQVAGRRWAVLRSLAGSLFFMAGIALLGRFLMGGDTIVGRSVGMPTEENLKAMVAAPELNTTFVITAFFASMVWGAAHALTPGHGKAIVGAYLIGARGTAWHALYLGLTVTVTHTLGVFILGLIATLAASRVQPETLYPWLGVLSGLIVLTLGVVMLINRIRQNRSAGHGHSHSHDHGHTHNHHHREEDHGHSHFHDHHHHGMDDCDHDHDGTGDHHHPGELPAEAMHSHHQQHGGHSHTHLPPGADGSPVTWRSLLTLGISGGLLPCPSAMVLLLTAVALHRIGFGLALVVAFSLGLAGVLTAVGLLFIKGSRLVDKTPAFASAGRWLPTASALVVALLGCAITWNAVVIVAGG